MIRAVLVDIDNTLLDFDVYVKESLQVGFAKFGLGTFDEERLAVFHRENHKVWRELEQGKLTYEDILKTRFNRIFAVMGVEFDGEVFEKYFKDSLFDHAVPVEGAMELLACLKERYIVCAASNGPYEQQVNRLKVAGMLGMFDHIFVSEAIGASKPSAAFFDHCMRVINEQQAAKGERRIENGEVMMIGDSLTSDMAGAVGSGIRSCYFDKQKSGKPHELKVDHEVMELKEILGIL